MKRMLLALVAALPTVAFAADQGVYPVRPEVNMPYTPKTDIKNTTGASTATATANPKIDIKVYVNGGGCGQAPCPTTRQIYTTRQKHRARQPSGQTDIRICTWQESMRSTPYPRGKHAVPKWNPRRNCCDWWVTRA